MVYPELDFIFGYILCCDCDFIVLDTHDAVRVFSSILENLLNVYDLLKYCRRVVHVL